ncbi:hypothetical protein QTI33_34605 [Variovorax sp. J22P271]|uniref:hypothetical protein n=1 Tax=Variovorax davisae TaxID=3053515 RepID=UPI0025754ADC|nr:hypothetical protein [Variovorax sp. J22P271]MDM0037300.1 hypothetical protein [Variovorax sp. J22P271]
MTEKFKDFLHARNTERVDGGDFGYDVYYARSAVEAMRHQRKLVATAQALAFQPGDKVGALIFNDGKRNTARIARRTLTRPTARLFVSSMLPPWTMHRDYGCVLADDVGELDRQAMVVPAG